MGKDVDVGGRSAWERSSLRYGWGGRPAQNGTGWYRGGRAFPAGTGPLGGRVV